MGAHTDPDRLQKPLVRVGDRGKEQWKAVTWDEAFTYIADKMKAIKAQHGAESISMFNHGVGVRFIQHVLKSYGCTNFAGPSFAQCRGPRDVASHEPPRMSAKAASIGPSSGSPSSATPEATATAGAT